MMRKKISKYKLLRYIKHSLGVFIAYSQEKIDYEQEVSRIYFMGVYLLESIKLWIVS